MNTEPRQESRPVLSRLRFILGAGALLAMAVPGVPLAANGIPRPAGDAPGAMARVCGSSYNPYAMSTSVLTACGDRVYPLQHIAPLPGGGSSYSYDVAGSAVVFDVPPAGFNALTAPASKLREYALPARAQLGATAWSQAMRSMRPVTPPRFLVSVSSATSDTNNWWVGNLADNHTYSQVDAQGKEPAIHASSCRSTAETTWAGLGGWNARDLAQDGTAYGVPAMASHQAWYEILPASMVPVDLRATAGREFEAATTHFFGAHRGFAFFMENLATGKDLGFRVKTKSYYGGTADVVTERPSIDGTMST
jgi:hypothetical protein